jgi:hypothetical protein
MGRVTIRSENGVVQAFGGRVSGGVEEGIQRHALKAVHEPDNEGEDGVESHGAEDQGPENFRCESKIEQQESRFDNPVHPGIVYFFDEEALDRISS